MIAKLRGKIDTLKPTELILDVKGVGYHLFIPFTTYEELQNEAEASLHVYTYIREDQLKLFGFHDEGMKELFSILLNISGIGPSMAISIISGISAGRLVESVKMDDASSLVKIPGIGKAKAEKLIFELKRKIKKLENFSVGMVKPAPVSNDAVDALITLGFDEKRSTSTVSKITEENPGFTLEQLIKEALKQLSG
jgi:holliday junction DNA helicase RuvA